MFALKLCEQIIYLPFHLKHDFTCPTFLSLSLAKAQRLFLTRREDLCFRHCNQFSATQTVSFIFVIFQNESKTCFERFLLGKKIVGRTKVICGLDVISGPPVAHPWSTYVCKFKLLNTHCEAFGLYCVVKMCMLCNIILCKCYIDFVTPKFSIIIIFYVILCKQK